MWWLPEIPAAYCNCRPHSPKPTTESRWFTQSSWSTPPSADYRSTLCANSTLLSAGATLPLSRCNPQLPNQLSPQSMKLKSGGFASALKKSRGSRQSLRFPSGNILAVSFHQEIKRHPESDADNDAPHQPLRQSLSEMRHGIAPQPRSRQNHQRLRPHDRPVSTNVAVATPLITVTSTSFSAFIS